MFVTDALAQTETPDAHVPAVTAPDAAHGPTEGAAHTEVPHEGAFPPFNGEFFPSQILWLAITFGVFFYVLRKTILPQIGGTLENRRGRIAADLDAAEKMKTDADAAQAAYEQELAEARARSHAIATEARDKAKADAEAERKRTEGELDGRLAEAQGRIGEIKTRALADVGQIAEDVTQTILADIVRIDVSREEAAGAVASVRT
ncbi:F0F1 ATP synthase subunit B [Aureimonas leprariae]|uniref:ATP synthase subunit b n=1 Tax=Plantimonas leprariae TaxID=2615207 RepID=A0A7V7PQ82_9HYPH|nr:F0F1 ATP synthase subunit B [Aureimonas leprariae]KAB0680261.1 F0F1 ATP synthase subunit B [Aureimonas leprariae]